MKRFEQIMEPPSCFELKTPNEIKDFGNGSENWYLHFYVIFDRYCKSFISGISGIIKLRKKMDSDFDSVKIPHAFGR